MRFIYLLYSLCFVRYSTAKALTHHRWGRYCGNSTDVFQPLGYLHSSDSRITVRFVSDDNGIVGLGFALSFREMVTGCGGSIDLSSEAPSSTVTSIGYPGQYPHNAECTWVISAPVGRRVQVQFEGPFGLEGHST